MSKKNVFKTDEELNKALDDISENYSKPPTKSEYLFVAVWIVLLPYIGIVGYVYDVSWLFYIIGGLITLTELFFLFTGALRCLGSILLIISCIIGYCITNSLWPGLLLGSCITASILSVGIFIILCFSGIATITDWIKGKRNQNS